MPDFCVGMGYILLLLHFVALSYNIKSLFKALWSRKRLCLAELLGNLSFKEATALFPHNVWERCKKYSFAELSF